MNTCNIDPNINCICPCKWRPFANDDSPTYFQNGIYHFYKIYFAPAIFDTVRFPRPVYRPRACYD